METSKASQELKALRGRAGMSVRAVADELGRPASSYAFYENEFKKDHLPMDLIQRLVSIWEPRGISRAEIMALGGIHSVSVEIPPMAERRPETAPDLNIQQLPRDVPVLGIASCGEDGLFEINDGDPIDFIRRPPRLSNIKGAYGLYVVGESMSPWREPGQPVYVHPGQPVSINDYVVVQVKPKRPGDPPHAYIKRLIRRNPKEIRLLQFSPRKEISLRASDVFKIHRIMEWGELMTI